MNAACTAVGGFTMIAGNLSTKQIVDGRLAIAIFESSSRQQAPYLDILGAVGRKGRLYRVLSFQDVEKIADKGLVAQNSMLQRTEV